MGQSGHSAQRWEEAAFGEGSCFGGALQATGWLRCASMNIKPRSTKAPQRGACTPTMDPPALTQDVDHLLPSPGTGRRVRSEDTHQQQQRSPGSLGTHLGGEQSHQHPPTPQHRESIASNLPSPQRPRPHLQDPLPPQSQCAHLSFWQRCGVRAERPAGTPGLCSTELRFTRSVTAGMNISWHALRDGSRELFMAHLETELMAQGWVAAQPPPLRADPHPFPWVQPRTASRPPPPPPPGAAIPPCPKSPPLGRTPPGAQCSGSVRS